MSSLLIFDPERAARIDRMIDEFQAARERRFMKQAMNEWQKAQARQSLLDLERPPDRVH